MVLLAATSLLLFFVTYALGKSSLSLLSKLLRLPLQTDFLGSFFIGLAASYVYFNLLSFFIPVNYLSLLLLILPGIFFWVKKENRQTLSTGFCQTVTLLFSPQNGPLTFGFLTVLFLFWVIPPGNWDSGDYHYLSIQWYEDYAVVPGLANVHGRFAFNPANFIISAAYSFTALAGQPLYPLNGVVEILFFTWLLRLSFQQQSLFAKTVVLCYALLLVRDTLINITSPSSDMLVMTLLSYCAVRSYHLISKKEFDLAHTLPLLLLTAFGPCTKLSALITLPLLLLLWFGSNGRKTLFLLFKITALFLLLWVPWLTRNAVMSGYLLYPIQHTNLINFDWTIPHEILLLDDFFTRYGSRGYHDHTAELARMNLTELTITWFRMGFHNGIPTYFMMVALAAFLLPLVVAPYKLFRHQLSRRAGLLFGVYYLAAIVWLIYSPEYRFGITILELLLLFSLLQCNWPVKNTWLLVAQMGMILFLVAHFSIDFVQRPSNQHLNFAKHWFFPPRDYRYLVDDNYRKTFPYKLLQPNTRLYYADTGHRCLNAPCLPCMSWPYGEIELRGETIQQGFRNVKNEVRKNYPWLPEEQ